MISIMLCHWWDEQPLVCLTPCCAVVMSTVITIRELIKWTNLTLGTTDTVNCHFIPPTLVDTQPLGELV